MQQSEGIGDELHKNFKSVKTAKRKRVDSIFSLKLWRIQVPRKIKIHPTSDHPPINFLFSFSFSFSFYFPLYSCVLCPCVRRCLYVCPCPCVCASVRSDQKEKFACLVSVPSSKIANWSQLLTYYIVK